MSEKDPRQLAHEVINKEKWWDMLSRFIDVLRVNIFVVDGEGGVILPPEEGRYGGRLLIDRSLKFDLAGGAVNMEEQFEPHGAFLEAINRYGLSSFAVPIKVMGVDQTIAYMIIGPVVLNRRLSAEDYERMAEEHGCDKAALLDELGGIRVVSNLMMNSILDLLAEIVRDHVELGLKERELDRLKSADAGTSPEEFADAAQEIYSAVYVDELLVTLLDVALKMTNTECGSIMVKDAQHGDLVVKASRGLAPKQLEGVRIRLGDGVAGIAARDNTSFVIHGIEGDDIIRPFLKRPEIKEALVMPLNDKDRVFGVLNLHTEREDSRIEGSLESLQHLSKLLSSAV